MNERANAGGAGAAAQALDDVRVLDLSTSVAGAWCSRMLADFGADVIAVEPRDGSPVRRLPPFAEGERSVVAEYVLANKRSVAMDLREEQARALLLKLVSKSSIVIESARPGELESLGLGYETFARRRPGLLYCSITPHGTSGPRAGDPGNELTAGARSGWASINGLAEREPLKPSGYQASYQAGTLAYGAVVAALCWRDQRGEGQRIEVAEDEASLASFAPALLGAQYNGQGRGRRERVSVQSGPVPVADGHFSLTLSRAHFWRDAMNLLGLTDLAEDERLGASWYRAQHAEEWAPRVEEAMSRWSRHDLFNELAVRRVVAGPVLNVDELYENEQLRAREFFVRPADAPNGPEYPGAPFKMSETPWRLRRRAPRVGEHTMQVLRTVAGVTDDHLLSYLQAGAVGPAGDELDREDRERQRQLDAQRGGEAVRR